jgi:glycosyltransferase involved in cell wall biosynthesis
MKVLFTPTRFFPFMGGVEHSSYHLSRHLVKLGCQVKVICAFDGPGNSIESIDGIKIVRIPYLLKIAATNITLGLPKKIWDEPFDIVQTYMPTPWAADWSILIGKLRHKKTVIYIKSDMGHSGKIARFILKIYVETLFKLSLLLVDKIFIVNQEWETVFKQTGKILRKHKHKIVVIPNGVDVNKFVKLKKNIGARNEFELLFISVFSKYHQYKGLDDLLRSLVEVKKVIPKISLKIAGEGELTPYYKNLVNELDLKDEVKFLGPFAQSKLVNLYSKASIFLLPSRGFEGHANVILESLACGTPVIASNVIGMATDIIKSDCGRIIEPGDTDRLAMEIIDLINNKQMLTKMGKNGEKLIRKKYRWEAVAENVLNEYKLLFGENK